MDEKLDVYDENKLKTGKIVDRSKIDELNANEYVVSVHCFIINSKNQILLSQRSLNKNRGGMWEDTHGGLKAGEESIDGIIRELSEELGLIINSNELKFLYTLKRKNRFRDIYILRKEIDIKDIIFKDNEVMNCKYVTIDELKTMIQNGECTFKNFEDTIFYNVNISDL